ncbi:MAG: DUF4365 domain-containing protein, partial [Actinobacteria bacterium]|nr:DUF4365 domain-containing protein [Actinomycetota bacterium]
MPKRPLQHQLETESRVAFEAALPSRLVYRTFDPDYGLDGEVEEFDDSETATGLRFGVQLKATADRARGLRVRLPLETAAYYRAQPVPVLMVLYVRSTAELYVRWFHEFDPYYEHVGDTHITFNWDADDLWTGQSAERLLADARKAAAAQLTRLNLPTGVDVQLPQGTAHGFSRIELELAIQGAAARCPEILSVATDPSESLVSVTATEDALTATLSGVQTVVIHIDPETYEPGHGGELLAADLLACVSFAFATGGHANVGARLAAHFLDDSPLARSGDLTAELASAMTYARRISETLGVVERLDQSDDREVRDNSFLFLIPALVHSATLRDAERAETADAYRRMIYRRQQEDDAQGAATITLSLATFHARAGAFGEAVEAYESAHALDASVASTDYWRQLAGAYFHHGRYQDAVNAYDRVLEVVSTLDPHADACRGDALLYAGRYQEARDSFAAIESGDPVLDHWVFLKHEAVSMVIDTTGIAEQQREKEAAEELAGRLPEAGLSDDEREDLARQIWSLDAASPLGWFNSARHLLNDGDETTALFAYLTTAVMQEGDVEAWVNAT